MLILLELAVKVLIKRALFI